MTTRPRVLAIGSIVFPEALKLLKSECDVKLVEKDASHEDFCKKADGMDGILLDQDYKVNEQLIKSAGHNLKVIATMSVGINHIDKKACQTYNVKVGNSPDVLTDTVVEFAVGLLLATARRFKEGISAVNTGTWDIDGNPTYLCGNQIAGSVVGIVGLGKIGFGVAKRLKGFNISKLLYSGNLEKPEAKEVDGVFVTLNKLLQESDFLVVCCSVNDSTRGMFNKDAFRKMKTSAYFVNVSRGEVVNQNDLYEALSSGMIAGAGLDVATPEPLPIDSPLLTLDNCLITPHIGAATVFARGAMSSLAARNILAGIKGHPLPAPVQID